MGLALVGNLHDNLVRNYGSKMIEWRRHLHTHPELSFQETQTAQFIAERLEEMGIETRKGVGGNGVLGILHGGHPGPVMAFRADFDALPIQDEKEVEYKSAVAGVMHACGHDGHTASLLGAAAVLTKHQTELNGSIVFIFQHAEELAPGGAKAMIEDGCLESVDVIYGIHLSSNIPYGKVGLCNGALCAYSDRFIIEIQGRGGHGAAPHKTVDSIAIGAQLVGHLQQIISRRISPLKPAVVSVGVFQAGHASNVIADKARIEGTARAFDKEVRTQIEKEIRIVTEGVCAASHATFQYQYIEGYPALINHPDQINLIRQRINEDLAEQVTTFDMDPQMGAEDFAYYLQERPGAFIFVGAQGDEDNTHYPHHHPRFDFDERALLISAKIFLSLAANNLSK